MDRFDRAVQTMRETNTDDPEHAHAEADGALLECVPNKVREAYIDLMKRCNWWADA